MSTINDGGPVFPVFIAAGGASVGDVKRVVDAAGVVGLSLRDYFAAKAMQGLLAQSCGTALGSDPTHGAQYAYQMADAMLAARKPNPNQ